MSNEQDKLEAINYEIGAVIQWLEDRIEYISEMVGIPFGIESHQEFLQKLVAIKAGSFPNLERMFDFYQKKITKLSERLDQVEDENWELRKKLEQNNR